MEIFKIDWQIKTSGKGLYEISNIVSDGLHSSGFSRWDGKYICSTY